MVAAHLLGLSSKELFPHVKTGSTGCEGRKPQCGSLTNLKWRPNSRNLLMSVLTHLLDQTHVFTRNLGIRTTTNIWANYNLIFHQPEIRWLEGYSPHKPPFGVRSCEVGIIHQKHTMSALNSHSTLKIATCPTTNKITVFQDLHPKLLLGIW